MAHAMSHLPGAIEHDAGLDRRPCSPADSRSWDRVGPDGKQILVEDPAGNVVELFQPA
jgi:hypothetical protein